MANFATLAELNTFMGTTVEPARGAAMLGYASAEIRGFCHQDIDVVTGRQEEFAAGLGRYFVSLTQTPVTAVSAITENLVAFTDFIWDRWGSIYRTDWTTWDDGPILVTYDSGFATTEDEYITVKSICLEVASRALGGPEAFGTFGSETAELRGTAPGIYLTPGEQATLSRYLPVMVA